MDKFLLFAIDSAICMAALYGLYWIFLKKETYFRFNRFYLLATIIFSCLIPLIHPRPIVAFNLSATWQIVSLIIYMPGVVYIATRTMLGIYSVSKLKMDGTRIKSETYSMVFSKQNLAPFSIFSTVFMNESLLNSFQKDYILNQEKTHIRQHHTFDKIFMEICLAVFWFNPFIWFIRKSLIHTHEYLADEGVRKKEMDLNRYRLILMEQGKGISPLCVSNDFNLMISRRIRIMCRSRSAFKAKLKPLLIIPVAFFLGLVFVFPGAEDHLLRDRFEAGKGERLILIDDRRDVAIECIKSLNSIHLKNHDVEAKRVRLIDGREGYFMNFYLRKGAKLEPAVFGYLTNEDFDVLRCQWQGDTAVVKFENSVSKAHMEFEWKPSTSGSRLCRTDDR